MKIRYLTWCWNGWRWWTPTDERIIMKEEFYTKNRWQNWINKIKESEFNLQGSEDEPGAADFVNAMDDVVLACLKVIARQEHDLISNDAAISSIDDIREIISEEHEPLGEDADLMIDSLRTSLTSVFCSCQRYIEKSYDSDTPFLVLVEKALEAEGSGRIDDALEILSQAGARVIGGETIPEDVFVDLPDSSVAELLDGIDAISAAMIGDDSYKEDVDAKKNV